jgi:mono/diheme cytochrome c family protein
MTPRARLATVALLLLASLAALAAWAFWPAAPVPVHTGHATNASLPAPAALAQVERGRYLATLGNCQGCHSLAGQPPYAGGTPIATPFGTVYGPNLTPSTQGLGGWSADDFWRALHWGQAPNGRWLSPAFPYPNTTHLHRADSDALFAYLRSLPPNHTPNRPSDIRWPYNTQAALKVWRALYFRPGQAKLSLASAGTAAPQAGAGDELARGRYLVQALGHCSACHAPRNRWGGGGDLLALSGGQMPSGWMAPSLLDPAEAGLQGWALADAVQLLGQGRSGQHGVSGPMAEVVAGSLRHWHAADLQAMATYLIALPAAKARQTPAAGTDTPRLLGGEQLYGTHCASCHGDQGQGWRLPQGQVAYPALAGNRTVTQASPANLIRIVQAGAFGLVTAQQPHPFSMPPYLLTLNDEALAALLTYTRGAWGNQAAPVTALQVHQLRNAPGQ